MRNVLLLAAWPMVLATLGAWIDEHRALGFTIWRSACRAAGLSASSVAAFTLELLPTAVAGALLGGLLVLGAGLRDRHDAANGALAAHAGCAIAMPFGILMCASAWPVPLTLAAELALALLVAAAVWWFTRIRKATYAGVRQRGVTRIPRAVAASENFPVNSLWNPHDCN